LNDLLTTTDTVIRFTWSKGVSNGGTTIIDYTIYYDQSVDTWIELESGITTRYYQTSITLSAGATYKFKVTARNTVGDSN
jgi:hypothetical protein